MQLLIMPLAAYDLEEIGDYIAQDNPIRAGTFVAELRAHCEKICLNPAGYRRRPDLSDDLRSCAHELDQRGLISVVADPIFNTQPSLVHKVRFVIGDQRHP